MKTYSRKKPASQEIKGVLDLCRLCLCKIEEGVPIFKDNKDVCAVLAMRIMICVGLETTYDNHLPNKICLNCCEELEKYYKFRRKCEMSYQRLKAHTTAIKEKEKTNQEETVNSDNLITKVPLEEDIQELLENQTELQQVEANEEMKDKPIEEIQIPTESGNTPDIATFLTTVLKELGVLVQRESGLEVEDAGPFELNVEGDQMTVELIEESDEVQQQLQEQNTAVKSPPTLILEPPNIKQIPRKCGKKSGMGAWCSECGRCFSSESVARRHALGHSGARPHACPACRRAFTQRAARDRHMLVHLAERPFKCSSCPKSFTQRTALVAHSRAHAAPPARPLHLHRCTLCDKVFLYPSGLSRHMSCHVGAVFPCKWCRRLFTDRSSLTRHKTTQHRNIADDNDVTLAAAENDT